MKKKILLLLLAGVLIFVAYVVCITAFVLFKTVPMPKLVDVKEADFLKMLESHQAVVKAISELTGPGVNSYSVIWSYKNPNPPGNDIDCATEWAKGSPDDLTALIKKYEHDVPPPPLPKPTLTVRLLRQVPLILFLIWCPPKVI
jgi:hypothetical protein